MHPRYGSDAPTAQPPARATEERFLRLLGDGVVASHPLTRGAHVIGRAQTCDLSLDDPSVSRRHATIHVSETLFIEDLDSANGTRLRGQRLFPGRRVPLEVGDAIELGSVLAVVQAGPLPAAARNATRAAAAPDRSIVIRDPAMHALYALVDRVAASEASVLLLGETGVGKEVVAHAVHARSPRTAKPFVAVNCAALAEPLVESELFGHERGAFTGAQRANAGLFAAAQGGTLFLDEVGELPVAVQAKLLRALETREVRAVGATHSRSIDVRFIAATSRDLARDSKRGEFRRDLYFRLAGVTLTVPPLRARAAEIVPLAEACIAEAAARLGRATAPRLLPDASAALLRHSWPGNVRELRNVVERAVLLCGDGDISAHELVLDDAPPPHAPEPAELAPEHLEERQRLVDALAACGGNQTKAALLLGMSRGTLLMRLDAYRIERPRKRPPFASR